MAKHPGHHCAAKILERRVGPWSSRIRKTRSWDDLQRMENCKPPGTSRELFVRDDAGGVFRQDTEGDFVIRQFCERGDFVRRESRKFSPANKSPRSGASPA